MDACYCSLCDKYFMDIESRARHLLHATNHPKCEKCNRYFANRNSLRNHYVISHRHHYCRTCDIDFETEAGLETHLRFAAVHRDDSEDDYVDDEDVDDSYEGWEDEEGRRLFPDADDAYPDVPVMFDDQTDPEDEYWDEDDQPPPEDDNYTGWAPVPRSEADNPPASVEKSPDPSQPSTTITSSARPHKVAGPTSSGSDEDTTPTLSLDCTICLEQIRGPTATHCGHIFCRGCITEALEVKKMCPVCRRPASPKHLRTLFFNAPQGGETQAE
ncbi:uncharacterized protein BXZ73DRAFT_88305 [Epithele typhae]|uniref:uncharacterized protein n=1 Tax=Epithele typhae TaxID=378194 RepID=UPI0020072454|nr:uncharacterized protein BXZ73DRAFT_88305 [Epithele typhae]KAH9941115.1 hypothetical protein BXZ73DRAFT_88305 [Epithele typhae]